MADSKYCYPDSDTLINKLNLTDSDELYNAEMELALMRLWELQMKPIKGNFGFDHLKSIHRYLFQDIYEWAGKVRTVEISKGNIFCTTRCIPDYARTVFGSYYPKCYEARRDRDSFIRVLADNYGDLNALHPFRDDGVIIRTSQLRQAKSRLALICPSFLSQMGHEVGRRRKISYLRTEVGWEYAAA